MRQRLNILADSCAQKNDFCKENIFQKNRDSLVYVWHILRLKNAKSVHFKKKTERVLRSSSVAVPQRGCIQTRGVLAVVVHCRHRLTSCRRVCDGCCAPITGTTWQPAGMKRQKFASENGEQLEKYKRMGWGLECYISQAK